MSFLLSLMFFSSTILEKRAEQVLPGSKRVGGGGDGGGQEADVVQTIYTHIH
jgi:hypothetical protein